MSSNQTFEGVSMNGDFHEALAIAIANAKTALTTDWIEWELKKTSGRDGGFILETVLRVEIEASVPKVEIADTGVVFQVEDSSTKDFFIMLVEPEKIAHARRILSGEEKARTHIQGTVVKKKAPYNDKWSFHLHPCSIDFFEFAIEVCDSTAQLIEDDLASVCGAFLPNCHWCPWTSKIIAEVAP